METLTVVLMGITWQSPDVDEDGLVWGIYRTEDLKGKRVVLKGKLSESMANQGMMFDVTGKWQRDRKYGMQFVFTNFSRRKPNGRWGSIAFMMQADGIGETIADRIYTKYGEKAIQELIDNPEGVAAAIPGLRTEVAFEASETLAPLLNESKLKLPLLSLFKGTKLPSKTANRVLDARIPDPVDTIKKNPFLLMDNFKGIAFKQCDSLRLKLKLPTDMPERITAACLQTFNDESDQTWLNEDTITKGMSKLLDAPQVNAKYDLETLVEAGKVVSRQEDDDQVFYAETKKAADEQAVAAALFQRMEGKYPKALYDAIDAIDVDDEHEITQHQKDVLLHNIKAGGRVLVLPGSPGTGKTYTLGRLLAEFSDYHACAPTGKAAQRLTQSLPGRTATTIHRMLEPKPISGGGFMFTLQNHEVDFDVVAVDEASMVNNDLAASLFRGLSPQSYLVLVGDQNQLPPVGPGTMLRDLQATGKFKELRDIERNKGMIVHSCAAIRDRKTPKFHMTPTPGTKVIEEKNVHLAMAPKDDKKAVWIDKICQTIESEGLSYMGGTTRSMQDIQFITVTHRNPSVGREVLNTKLQARFNPNGGGDHKKFRVGDKVICTENCFLKADGKTEKVFVANGDLGVVTQSMEKRVKVKVTSSGEEVMVPCGKDGVGWDLGYAITCHKFQGSEAPICIVVMGSDYGSEMVMSREWLYTAISRAKECCILICGPGQVAAQIRKVRIHDRLSYIPKYWSLWNGEVKMATGRTEEAEEAKDFETEMVPDSRPPRTDPLDF